MVRRVFELVPQYFTIINNRAILHVKHIHAYTHIYVTFMWDDFLGDIVPNVARLGQWLFCDFYLHYSASFGDCTKYFVLFISCFIHFKKTFV